MSTNQGNIKPRIWLHGGSQIGNPLDEDGQQRFPCATHEEAAVVSVVRDCATRDIGVNIMGGSSLRDFLLTEVPSGDIKAFNPYFEHRSPKSPAGRSLYFDSVGRDAMHAITMHMPTGLPHAPEAHELARALCIASLTAMSHGFIFFTGHHGVSAALAYVLAHLSAETTNSGKRVALVGWDDQALNDMYGFMRFPESVSVCQTHPNNWIRAFDLTGLGRINRMFTEALNWLAGGFPKPTDDAQSTTPSTLAP